MGAHNAREWKHRNTAVLGLLAAGLGVTLALTAASAGAGANFVDRDCADFSTQAAAQNFFLANGGPSSDPHQLDADHDGIACESNPCPCNYSTTPTTPPTTTTTIPTTTTPLPPAHRLTVARVVDGDTLDVSDGSTIITVRLIGIDTPETVRPDYPFECGGPQATRSLQRLARPGDVVRAFADPTQDDQDIYGRSLRYVEDAGRDYGQHQLAAGWAKPYVYDVPFQRLRGYKTSAKRARRGDRGAWGRCHGNFHSAA
jgi:endonuclease YncB( thermonuclease family)